jgi:hypothetical protein
VFWIALSPAADVQKVAKLRGFSAINLARNVGARGLPSKAEVLACLPIHGRLASHSREACAFKKYCALAIELTRRGGA